MEPGSPLPLDGWRVAVTRSRRARDDLAVALSRRGADVVSISLTRTAPPRDPAALLAAVRRLHEYDWIVFTSDNAVRSMAHGMGRDAKPSGRVAAVGSATAAAVEAVLGWSVDLVPDRHRGADLAAALIDQAGMDGVRVLWPRARVPAGDLRTALTAAGAVVDDPVAYRTLPDPAAVARLRRLVESGAVHAITFAAPSAARTWAEGGGGGAGAVIAVIGPTTAAAARRCGLPVHVVARESTMDGLAGALAEYALKSKDDARENDD